MLDSRKVGVSDRCDPACLAALNSTDCGHYTPLVWRTTRELGCAYATCRREGFLDECWVCNCSPRGKIQGRSPY
jgi:cysteine-rich secretory family protein